MEHAVFDPEGRNLVLEGDNLEVLPALPDETFAMIYLDPPFNTGRAQRRVETTGARRQDGTGDRVGFGGRSYQTVRTLLATYDDSFTDYWEFLEPRLLEAWRLLKDTGTLYLHLDYREVHYAKVMLDVLFGRECFLNEIIWAYDYGGRTKKRWPTKHDTILVYVKNPETYYFDSETVDREPYMAPGLVTPEKAARGKLPTDVWWHTIVSPTGREKTGYPTQKPLGLLRRMVQASSREGDWVLDFFAGSGTLGEVAASSGRRFVCIDSSAHALEVMEQRLGEHAQVRRADQPQTAPVENRRRRPQGSFRVGE
ncbi:DNA-methyltransferase [Nesterenkonia lacusekhoensis]|uniref:Site-specific DNA-methyltransferase (Adenine-specific) n=1 Tax=Nesterenkonia lacusekhoensis TaxID=150832 RepID=A0ABS4SZC9_9MICC|nr:site-specific DNA-methyltransferase (adenine-specific) [Nesterenkonia lacusekhoensis]